MKVFPDIDGTGSLGELRAQLADFIGWREAVPAAALLRLVTGPAPQRRRTR
jgi:hypothetical protein